MTDNQLRSIAALREAQIALVDEVTGSWPSRLLVHAPTGSGKSTAAIAAANQLLAADPLSRIAFLVSHEAMSHSIADRLEAPTITVSSKASLVSAEHGLPAGIALIPQRTLSSLGTQAFLFENRWDLVVVDEAEHLNATGRATLKRLAEAAAVHRLLVLSRGLLDIPDPWLTELQFTKVLLWHVALEDWGQVKQNRFQVRYVRSPTELSLMDRATEAVSKVARWLESDSIERLQIAKKSTLFAFQAEILGIGDSIRKRRNALAHPTTDAAFGEATALELGELTRALPELASIADDLDTLRTDTKVETLRRVIGDLSKRNAKPTVVFVQPDDSARYLGSVLSDLVTPSFAASTAPPLGQDIVNQVADQRGLIVVPDAALPGYDLRKYTVGVHFDSDLAEDTLNEREARVGTVGLRTGLLFVALVEREGDNA